MDEEVGRTVRGRVPYRPIVDRPALRLPDGARVAVFTVVNVEVWRASHAMPRAVMPPPMGQPLLPDVPNWAWHEYGMRVGFWRLRDALAKRGVKATFAVNGAACRVYEPACRAAREAGWEFIGHGFEQGPMHRVGDQRGAIRDTIAALADFTGIAPRGWESPGLTETDETLDLLAEAGIEYACDWPLDDQPVEMQVRSGRMVAIPYPVEINDVAISAVQGHSSDEILRRGRDTFDRLYREGASNARVMPISLHPYLSGVPHRIGYVEALLDHIAGHEGVVWMTGGELLDWHDAAIGRPAASPAAGG